MKYFTITNFLILASLISLGFSFWFGKSKLNGAMVVAFIAFLALLFFAHIDKISYFKASKGGFEAQTREVITKAENTIKELQLLSKVVSSTTLSLVSRAGRASGGYSDEEIIEIKKSLEEILRKVNIPEEEIKKVINTH